MIMRRVNILYVQETKWKGQKANEVKIPASNFSTLKIRQLRMT
jgi:hypothetical protein